MNGGCLTLSVRQSLFLGEACLRTRARPSKSPLKGDFVAGGDACAPGQALRVHNWWGDTRERTLWRGYCFFGGDTLERTLGRGYCGGDTVEGMHKGAWVKYQNDMAWFLFGNRLIFLWR